MDWLLSHPVHVLVPTCIVAVLMAWRAIERQSGRQLAAAGAILALGAALSALAWRIDTPSESAERVVLAFIERAVAADAAGAATHLEPDAGIHFGGFTQPRMDRREIDRDLSSLQGRHRVTSHVNLQVDARTEGQEQVIGVCCLTETQSSPVRVLTTWSFRVRPSPDGRWRIHAISFDLIAGSSPRPGIF